MEIITKSAQDTQNLGKKIGSYLIHEFLPEQQLSGAAVITLSGPLGSGKTTFVKGIAKGFGISARILSPTYTFIRAHETSHGYRLVHIDLYRLQNENDLPDLGISELLIPAKNIVIIEWPQKAKKLLPHKRIDIAFSVLEGEKHRLEIVNTLSKDLPVNQYDK